MRCLFQCILIASIVASGTAKPVTKHRPHVLEEIYGVQSMAIKGLNAGNALRLLSWNNRGSSNRATIEWPTEPIEITTDFDGKKRVIAKLEFFPDTHRSFSVEYDPEAKTPNDRHTVMYTVKGLGLKKLVIHVPSWRTTLTLTNVRDFSMKFLQGHSVTFQWRTLSLDVRIGSVGFTLVSKPVTSVGTDERPLIHEFAATTTETTFVGCSSLWTPFGAFKILIMVGNGNPEEGLMVGKHLRGAVMATEMDLLERDVSTPYADEVDSMSLEQHIREFEQRFHRAHNRSLEEEFGLLIDPGVGFLLIRQGVHLTRLTGRVIAAIASGISETIQAAAKRKLWDLLEYFLKQTRTLPGALPPLPQVPENPLATMPALCLPYGSEEPPPVPFERSFDLGLTVTDFKIDDAGVAIMGDLSRAQLSTVMNEGEDPETQVYELRPHIPIDAVWNHVGLEQTFLVTSEIPFAILVVDGTETVIVNLLLNLEHRSLLHKSVKMTLTAQEDTAPFTFTTGTTLVTGTRPITVVASPKNANLNLVGLQLEGVVASPVGFQKRDLAGATDGWTFNPSAKYANTAYRAGTVAQRNSPCVGHSKKFGPSFRVTTETRETALEKMMESFTRHVLTVFTKLVLGVGLRLTTGYTHINELICDLLRAFSCQLRADQ